MIPPAPMPGDPIKGNIIAALQRCRPIFQTEIMCYVITQGGYERVIQYHLAYELNQTGSALTERNKRDIWYRQGDASVSIELGVNGLKNPREQGLINHVVNDDVEPGRLALGPIYTVSVADLVLPQNQRAIDNADHIVKYYGQRHEPYVDGRANRNNDLAMIRDIGVPQAQCHYFGRLDGQFQEVGFETAAWSGYKAWMHMFVCGPFVQAIEQWW